MIFPNNYILKISMYASSTVGIWPIIFMKSKRIKKFYNIFSTILYYYYVEYILRAYYQLFRLLTAEHLNLEEILGNFCVTLIYTVTLFRLRAFNNKAVRTLFSNIIEEEKLILNDPDSNIKKIYFTCVQNNRNYNILFLFNGLVVSIIYFAHPFLVELPTVVKNNQTIPLRVLPLSTWWPINTQKHFWLAYCWNVFDGTLGSSYVISSDILTFSLIVFALSQLRILSYRLRNFTYFQIHTKNRSVRQKIFREKFIFLIKEHQKIIGFIGIFNDTMKYVMLFDFLQCSVQLATIILQLLVMEINAQNIILVGEFLFTMIIRLVIYYFNANEVIYQSQHLATDVWKSDWYEQSEDVRQMMLFLILRAQKPLKFLIGPFSAMSLETFITILKATYSYMMLFINTSR
nr:odorant receptor 17 [Pachyrhinus yasumatsui]